MASDEKSGMIYRCPVCLAREIDVVLKVHASGYYCVKCGYTGDLADIKAMYAAQKRKYRLMTTRLTLEALENL